MKVYTYSIPAGLVFMIFTYACAVSNNPPVSSFSQSSIESSQEMSELNSKLLKRGATSPVSPADYLIGPADLLEVRIFESEKLTTTARVSSRGQITLPLLGGVDVDGLTAREAEQRIESFLKEGQYINNPHVSLFISENKSKLVSVVGFVREPGNYELVGKLTLIDALAAARGLKDRAGRTVYVTRSEENGRKQAYMVDLDELLQKGDAAKEINLVLKPGDVIYVPEAGNVFVEGAVRSPGSIQIKEGLTTVSQVISEAGGFTSYANSRDVTLIRYLGNGERELIKLDLDQIRDGAVEDPKVNDRDAIVVASSGFKRLIYGLRLSLGFGLVGVGYDPPERYRDIR
ncbi:polysaccharide export protein [Desulfobacterota bacterium AH_259_B03_O07]|nr:polysaccharide export protein [Desulfobacterota bacterium AH_259_B03_O07]